MRTLSGKIKTCFTFYTGVFIWQGLQDEMGLGEMTLRRKDRFVYVYADLSGSQL